MKIIKQIFGVMCFASFVFGSGIDNLSSNTTNENKTVFLKAPLPNDGAAHAKETQLDAKSPRVDCSSKK
jgi:hypothetical protein